MKARSEQNQNCYCVLWCVRQLCSVMCTHTHTCVSWS